MSTFILTQYLTRTTARLQLLTIKHTVTASIIAAVTTGSVVALLNYRLGFGRVGVRPRSFAASWHSQIGQVDPGSIFSALQSAGAGGSGALTVYGIPAAGAALITIVLGLRMRNRATVRRLVLKRQDGIEQQMRLHS